MTGARDRAADTLGEAPLLALAGGLAAGALIAALLPRTGPKTRSSGPTARRVKDSARAAVDAARDTGTQRLDELGLSREKGEETIRSLLERPDRCREGVGQRGARCRPQQGLTARSESASGPP